ncbi:MAG: molecular chaperone HtpG [Anaerolineales bacterium]|uniref:Chaperone protein HtpG n=1 Tax=Candidatus Desulfolinea nitratireducens TaxID=2841698 RepID=A0A8J6TI09_9CHLR|nr:molecular chaperone HtpG [Candidatus Desulfolinea nitratireducens]MBL6959884.1 molecular chaperone HtpG [Anaerolineales bacterium]
MAKASKTDAQSFSFKAETKQLLNILIHSLYKDPEVFLRELLSNASDALNRAHFEMLTNQNMLDSEVELNIRITADKDKGMLTIQDTGIGMTKDEIIENLGTIAQSGARNFIEAAKDKEVDIAQMIGQFGVGFYSVFMAAEWVRVTSRSHKSRAKAVSWYATGEDNFEVNAAEMDERGTKIEIKLKKDAIEFAEEYHLKTIVKKHSDYIGFPIYVGESDEQVNKQTSLWRTPRSEAKDEEYQDFYRQLTLEFEKPLLHIHAVTDAPVQLYALLYVPSKGERGMFSLRKDDGLKLYSRNILIDEYNKDLLPEYLRFVQGVVDSEDLPLNVSRETVQSVGLMPKLKKIVTGQVMRELENLANNDPEKFNTFWEEFGIYLKQGIAAEPLNTEKVQPLLRFKTNLHTESWSSLDEYIERMKVEQKEIYYIIGNDPKSVLLSPHLDYFQTQGTEVLLLTDPMDSFMLMGLQKYKDHDLKNVAQADVETPEAGEKEGEAEKIPEGEFGPLIERFKGILGERVTDVRASNRLSQSVARLVDPDDSLNPELQRVYQYLGKEYEVPKKILELNPSHTILKLLITKESDSDLQTEIIEQIYESALLVEGLHPDPSSMAPRIQKLMEMLLS